MEPEGSLPDSQMPATCPYPERTRKTCEFIIYVENFLHVPANFRGHLQGGAVRRICYKEITTNVET